MTTKPSAVLVGGGIALGLVGLWLLSEGTQQVFSQSPRPLRGSAAQFHAALESLEERVPAGSETPDAVWLAHIRTIDDALERKAVEAAIRASHDAYGAAFAVRKWEAMVAVGNAMLRIAGVARSPHGLKPNARQAYLVGLIRARRDGSVDGVLRVAEAFAALGDGEIARQCLVIAARLAIERGDCQAAARARAASERLDDRLIGSLGPTPF